MNFRHWQNFWSKKPALYYGMVLLLGTLFTLSTPLALLPCSLLAFRRTIFKASLFFLFPFFVFYQFYYFPEKGECLKGIFFITNIKKDAENYIYTGILKTPQGKVICQLRSSHFYSAHLMYEIEGFVKAHHHKEYILRTKKPWISQKSHWTLAEWRFAAQTHVRNYIKAHYKEASSAQFISGMLIGGMQDKRLHMAFSALGLSHLMAISGLHFGLISIMLHLMLRPFFSYKVEATLLMLLLTLYFLFVGYSPSILRAWITVMMFLLALLCEKKANALNALGVALLVSLLWQPLNAANLSFQLSFLATAGILCLYPLTLKILNVWIPICYLENAIKKSLLWQLSYLLLQLFKKTLALTLSIQISLLPLQLHYFHQFSLSCIFYNLFFPVLASLSLVLFLLGTVLPSMHLLNNKLCHLLLSIVESPPINFVTWRIEHLPNEYVCAILLLVLGTACYLKSRKKENVADVIF